MMFPAAVKAAVEAARARLVAAAANSELDEFAAQFDL
jgi:hypothetical protein